MDPYDRLQAGDELSESLMPPLSTGEMLAIRREELGYSLAQAADALRIRYVYLQAIEDGRYHDLPGTAYAIGFVRSYAEFLGLEPDEAVARFKQEIHGLERAPSLSFPVPKPEGKVPGGALILISVLLIALGYGAWYFLTTSGSPISEVLPSAAPVEEQNGQAVESASDGSEQTTTGSAETADGAEQAPADTAAGQGSDTAATGETPAAETQTTATPTEGTQAAPADRTVLAADQPGIGAGSEIEIPSTSGTTEAPADAATMQPDQAASQPAAEADTPEVGVENATQTAVVEPPAAPQLPPGAAAGGRIFGANNADARVVLAATSDSWVQVRDAEGELLLTQVLRTGDSFLVPNEPGITMRTGNAGGLSITVDGRQIASLGALGDVIDGVLLEPDRLLNGTAVSPR